MNIQMCKKDSVLKLLSLFLIASISFNCKAQQQSTRTTSSASDGIPAWVNDPSSAFSERQYLMAVGSGDNLSDARADAMLNLAQIFKSRIEGTQNLFTEFSETTRNNTDFTSRETIRLMNNIRVGANEELMNTEVLKSEVGSDGAYYVLAGMNRTASERVYLQEIANNYQRIRSNKERAMQSNAPIQKLSLLKENVLLARINENLNQQLEILSPGSNDSETAIEAVASAQEQFEDAQQTSIINLTMATDNQVIKDAIAAVFQKEGFILGDIEPILTVNVTYEAAEANLNRDDAEFVIWDLSINITETNTGKEYNTFSSRGRDGALSLSDAFKRAEFTAGKEIETNFSRFLNNEVLSND